LTASEPAAISHVVAALTTATLEAHKTASDANIQTVLSPNAITAIANFAGWKLSKTAVTIPEEGLLDGSWEVGAVKRESFLREIDETIGEERVKVLLQSMRTALLSSLPPNGTKVRTMDVWIAQFE
jgi:hypothetical protein